MRFGVLVLVLVGGCAAEPRCTAAAAVCDGELVAVCSSAEVSCDGELVRVDGERPTCVDEGPFERVELSSPRCDDGSSVACVDPACDP